MPLRVLTAQSITEPRDRWSHCPPSHISNTVLSVINMSSVTPLLSRRTILHTTGIASPRCADRLPSDTSKMAVSTVSGGGPYLTILPVLGFIIGVAFFVVGFVVNLVTLLATFGVVYLVRVRQPKTQDALPVPASSC